MLKRMIVLLMVLLLCGCGAKEAEKNTVMIANPFTTHEALAEAEKAADITLTLPEDLSAFPAVYRAANNGTLQLIEVIFDCEGNEVRLRKSPGTEDNSGVYEEFEYLKKKLGAEGLFDVEHKQDIPRFAKRVADSKTAHPMPKTRNHRRDGRKRRTL